MNKNTNRMEYIIHNPGVMLGLAVCIQNLYNVTIFLSTKLLIQAFLKNFFDLIFQ